MMLSEQQIHDLIAQGEGISLEFKTCAQQLNRDVYQSVCAFLNRHGGFLLLGVQDNGNISGIAPQAVEQVRKDFVTTINNPQKLTPPAYLSIETVTIHDKIVLLVHVPESSQVHRCNGRIYDRKKMATLTLLTAPPWWRNSICVRTTTSVRIAFIRGYSLKIYGPTSLNAAAAMSVSIANLTLG